MNYKNMSLKSKLLVICTTLATFTAGVGTLSYFALDDVSSKYDHVAKIDMPNAIYVAGMRGSYRRARVYLNLLAIGAATKKEMEENIADVRKALDEYERNKKAYLDIPFSEGKDVLYKRAEAGWEHFVEKAEEGIRLSKSASKEDGDKLDRLVLYELDDTAKELGDAFAELIKFHETEGKKWSGGADSSARSARKLNLALIVLGFAAAQLIGFLFARSLSRQLKGLAEQLGQGADEVASASLQISGASTELSESSTEQAAALQETVASLDEVSAMVNKNSDNAKRSQELSAVSQTAANKGKQVVEEMIGSIDEINRSNAEIMSQIEESNREISEIVKVISEIGNKTKVINDIVFQTKLLSFNASVEAARAGEHGKGFAVVAEEVGNLAQMSGNAAKEISQMLEGSIQKVEGIVTETKTRVERLVVSGKEKVDFGTTTAKKCGEVLDEIVRNVENVSALVSEISTASQEQAQGVREINQAVGQLEQAAQTNHSAARMASGAADELQQEATSLREMVAKLEETVRGETERKTDAAA